MALGDYVKTAFVNGGPPGISAERLNNNENKTAELDAAQAAHLAESASETVKGHVELATATETTAGTDNTRAVHPAGLKFELDKKIPKSIVTAAGDLLVATGNATLASLVKGNIGEAVGVKTDGSVGYIPTVKIARGTWDNQISSIAANTVYTKTIPIGFNATRGRATFFGGDDGSYGVQGFVLVSFDTTTTGAITISEYGSNGLKYGIAGVSQFLSDRIFGGPSDPNGYIYLQNIYISGGNLVIEIKNNYSEIKTMYMTKCVWEVEG